MKKLPFIALFIETPTVVTEKPVVYDEKLQMNLLSDDVIRATEQETQVLTHRGEPDYERDWESD